MQWNQSVNDIFLYSISGEFEEVYSDAEHVAKYFKIELTFH